MDFISPKQLEAFITSSTNTAKNLTKTIQIDPVRESLNIMIDANSQIAIGMLPLMTAYFESVKAVLASQKTLFKA